ncbi:MAG: hypothetical protein IJ122_06150 [Methanobrevibacter sp.]|nr:hypothetical protein [Methanobrevibacter sp.]
MNDNLLTGPFTVKFGTIQLEDVSEISWDYSSNSSNPTTIDGRTFDIPTTTSAAINITLLGADIDVLCEIFPQFAVEAGGTMSTGEVTSEKAFDCKAMSACGTIALNDDLEVIGCDATTRLVNARARISAINYQDNVIQTVQVRFTGQPAVNQAVFQIYKNGSLSDASS